MKPIGSKITEEGRRSIKILSDRATRSKSFQEKGSTRFTVRLEVNQNSPDTLRALACFSPSERNTIIRQIFEEMDDSISTIMAVKAMVKKRLLDRELKNRKERLKEREERSKEQKESLKGRWKRGTKEYAAKKAGERR